MKQFAIVIVLGAALFTGAAWQFELFEAFKSPSTTVAENGASDKKVRPEKELGEFLYPRQDFVDIPPVKRRGADPIMLYGTMNPLEQEEVASQVNGKILFIGDQVEDAAVLASGSAAFLTEPYYFAPVYAGRESFVKFYRRLYEGENVNQGQMVATIEPAEALGSVLEEIAKIKASIADHNAALSAEAEGKTRERRAFKLWKDKALSEEEYGSALLTWKKLEAERISKGEAIKLAEIKKDQADIRLRTHEIRPTLPYSNSTIKSIIRQRGYVVKQGDPVMIVENLGRLRAEATVEAQYFAYLQRNAKNLRATIEPTVLEKPQFQFPGHALPVTSLAVTKDLKIVSGSEDRTVCIWSQEHRTPIKQLELDDAVRVVACTPDMSEKNVILAGCANGSIYLWNLADDDAKPIKIVDADKAHGKDTSITALAFSPDGKYFASGASDGSIRMWATWVHKKKEGQPDEIDYAIERYAFVPANGVASSHEDAVTALHFTPQCRLVSAGRDKTLRVWVLKEKGAVLEGKIMRDRVGNIAQLGVSRKGTFMLFDQGHTLKLHSIKTHTLTNTLSVPANSTPFDTLAIFSPDDSLLLTAGAPEGRLQLWRTPDADTRGFEVRQFAPVEGTPPTCAAFAPNGAFAVSASGTRIYQWAIPSLNEVKDHQIHNVRLTLMHQSLDASKQGRVAFEVPNTEGRFEAGRPVTIVIE